MAKIDYQDTRVTRIQLCGVQGCCPTVEIHHASGTIVITDDNGSKVNLTKEQFRDILAKVKIDE
jgi:hypothetical protein